MNMLQTVQKAKVTLQGKSGPVAPDTLMGMNVEITKNCHSVLVSDRLENPKFCGPANGQTGLAEGWHPHRHNMGGMHCRLVPGMSLSGGESQMVHVYGGTTGRGIVQHSRQLRAGEVLEAEVWARVRHHPVTLKLSLVSGRANQPYDSAEMTIDASYWKKYTVTLKAPADDDIAIFSIMFLTEGQVLFDQVHLRPAGESSHLNRETMDILEEMNPPTLRFPGGSLADCYHWRYGTGPVHLRPSLPDPCFKWRIDYDFGIEEYLQLCADRGLRPFLTVSLANTTLEEAGELAGYCAEWYRSRGLALPEAYFMIGNEQHAVWEPGHMDAAMYVQVLRDFVPLIRSGYPGARIIALGYSQCHGVGEHPKTLMRQSVIQEAAGLFDVLATQFYATGWSDAPEERGALAAHGAEQAARSLSAIVGDLRKAGSSAKVALTEWNYWTVSSHWDKNTYQEPDDAMHGLFFAGAIHAMARLAPDLETACFYNLFGGLGLLKNRTSLPVRTGVLEAYTFYRPAFPGEVLPLETESPQFGNGRNVLDALSVKGEKDSYLYLCNRSAELALSIELEGWRLQGAEAAMLKAEHTHAPLRESEPPAVGGNGLELPPLSVVRLKLAGE